MASAKIHRALDEKTPVPQRGAFRITRLRGLYGLFMSSRQRNFSRQISNPPSCARTNGYESKKFGFFDGGTTSLQVNTDCVSMTTSAAPSPKGGDSGCRRRPQGRSRAPNGDRDEAPRGYCWGHHLRSDRRRYAKTRSQGRAEADGQHKVTHLRASSGKEAKTRHAEH